MSEHSPRILLVDDQRQVSRMLRASLELSGKGYTVVDVASGEEALLELSRAPVDLLVTDLRLPGMSGLDLLSRSRELNPHARAIVITGQPTDEIQAQAQALGVVAFLRKPIGTNFFLEAVARGVRLSEGGVPIGTPDEEVPRIADLLTALRRDLEAEAVFLIDEKSNVATRAGNVPNLDLAGVLPWLMTTFSSALRVGHLLSPEVPANVQFFAGEAYDLYLTNIGEDNALLVAFEGRQGAARAGRVMELARPAAVEMLGALAGESGIAPSARAPEPPAAEAEAPVEKLKPGLDAASRKSKGQNPDEFWSSAVRDNRELQTPDGDALTYEQAVKLGLLHEDSSKG
jgi:CheY-like chemotaxis protein